MAIELTTEQREKLIERRWRRFNFIKERFSIQQMADALDTGKSTIYNFINGEQSLSVDNLFKLSLFTGESMEYLLGYGEGEGEEAIIRVCDDRFERRNCLNNIENDNYAKLSFKTIEGLRAAKRLQRLSGTEIGYVDDYIDFLVFRKKIRSGDIESEPESEE